MRYTLRQLEVFLAAATVENISLAARALNMSQSAASSALKELESHFKIQLFDRVGKRLQLNELGHSIRPHAQRLLDQALALQGEFSQHCVPGNLKVGATLTIGNYLALEIISRYKEQFSGAHVSLEVNNTANIIRLVDNYDLDIGLIEGELNSAQLNLSPWREDELCVFSSPQHPLAKQLRLTDEQLVSAAWVAREPGSGTRQTFERAMSGLLAEMNIVLELQHTEAIKRAVQANLGLGCLSRVTLEEELERGTFVVLPVPHRNFKRHFYFVTHKHKYLSAGIEAWISLCREMATSESTG